MIKNIVFSAGSMGGLAFIGAWKALEELNYTKDIINFGGCSIGSVMAFLLTIGYTTLELETLAMKFRYKDISDIKIIDIINNLGFDTGNDIERLLKELLFHKTGYHDMPFSLHFSLTGRKLLVNASCVEEDKPYYFCYESTPDLSIIKAIRMSISLPMIMSPVQYKDMIFIDGGFHDPCPGIMFPIEGTILFRVKNMIDVNTINDRFIKYIGNIMLSIYNRLHVCINDKIKDYKVIWIDTGIGQLSLDINKATKKYLIDKGYIETKKHA